MTTNDMLRVVILEEKDTGFFVAQCLEYDICAQAETIERVKERFAVLLEVERHMSVEDSGEAFAGIPTSPDVFHELWISGDDLDDGASTHFRMAA